MKTILMALLAAIVALTAVPAAALPPSRMASWLPPRLAPAVSPSPPRLAPAPLAPRLPPLTFDEVVALALALPGTTLGTSYGTPAVKVGAKADGRGGTLLIRLREDGDMVLRAEDGLRDALIATQPDVFFTTPHYDGHPYVLVRLAAAEPEQIGGLIARAHAQAGPAKRRR